MHYNFARVQQTLAVKREAKSALQRTRLWLLAWPSTRGPSARSLSCWTRRRNTSLAENGHPERKGTGE